MQSFAPPRSCRALPGRVGQPASRVRPAAPVWLSALVLGLAAGLATPAARAQGPARPAAGAAPAAPAADATRTLGSSGSGSGPVLTREELRACLDQEEAVRKRLLDGEAQRTQLDKERDALMAEREGLAGERARVDAVQADINALGERSRAYAGRVERWNERVKAFNDGANRGGPSVDRERNALNAERETLEKERVAIDTERARLVTQGEDVVKGFNAKSRVVDDRINDWNGRNARLNAQIGTARSEREEWVRSCGNRRYREDDEIAIRRGK